MTLVSSIVALLSALTFASNIFIVGVVLLLLSSLIFKKQLAKPKQKLIDWVDKNWLNYALLVAIVATLGSLFLSEIAGYPPCKLCWYQRILMYPNVLILGFSLWRQRYIADIVLSLSFLGFLVSGYHYVLQMIGIAIPGFSDACSATGQSCISTAFVMLGYITIPMMAFTAFTLLLLFCLLRKSKF